MLSAAEVGASTAESCAALLRLGPLGCCVLARAGCTHCHDTELSSSPQRAPHMQELDRTFHAPAYSCARVPRFSGHALTECRTCKARARVLQGPWPAAATRAAAHATA